MTTASTLKIALNEARADNERLTVETAKLRAKIDRLREANAGLANRIEELEEDVRKEWLIGYNEDYHITDAQIDAAWAFVIDPPGYLSQDAKDAVEAALGALGIERCDEPECRGGVIQHLETPLEPGDDYGWNQKCPDCNGRGWIKT